jgi:hypothetical protein
MSESDFMDITLNGTLCNAVGEIGRAEFEQIMRHEMNVFLQVRTHARDTHNAHTR